MKTWVMSNTDTPTASIAPNRSDALAATRRQPNTINMIAPIAKVPPINPDSSAITANMKSL